MTLDARGISTCVFLVALLGGQATAVGQVFFPRVDYSVGPGWYPMGIVAADINGDLVTDLVTANPNSQDVTVLLNDG